VANAIQVNEGLTLRSSPCLESWDRGNYRREPFEVVEVPKTVDRQDVQDRLAEGAQLVDVLPEEQYEEQHLPGAVSIPLKSLGEVALERLDPGTPVIAYCWDFQ
jgi:phage shock protein E